MTAPLKPCPFCGAKARMLGGPEAQETYSVWCTAQGRRHHITGTMDEDQTAEIWNTRPETDRLIAEAVAVERGVWVEAAIRMLPEAKYLDLMIVAAELREARALIAQEGVE